MKFIRWIKMFFSRSEKRSQSQYGSFARWFEPYNIFTRMNNETLATNETIFSAINRLSNSLASLPLKVYRNYQPVQTRIADMMENSPNPNMTGFDFIRTMEAFRDTYGNAYALKQYDSHFQVVGLYFLDPSKVKPVIEKESKELYYEIHGDDGTYYIHNMDIVHVKHIHTIGYEGISPLKVLKNSIDYDTQVKQFSLDQMESGIKASFALKIAASLSKEKKAEMLEMFKSFYSKNGSGVILLDAGHDLKELKQDIIDMKVFEVERITRSRVATVYNLPPHMLGDFSDTNFSSMEQQALEYVQNTILPIVRMYEQEFNKKLLTPQERRQGLTFKFNINGLLRGDIKTRGDFYFKGIRSGWFTPNEVRAYEELPPVEGGDKLYMSRDLSPIDDPTRNGKGVNKKNEPKTDNADG
ncbi:phage portal protein [Aneurinibacillus thermoaerophilus]|uniref:phage portal protein n=1 Tax=Aneurinibacillus thermoaerophilus TaxID=143495 RepID=UPI002E1AD494|nr:phage portal protein [Aneurinibacillus thermoaerophilus]MED0676978.1 phage portal protein [Aneurinibacillus thermoaerophilus]